MSKLSILLIQQMLLTYAFFAIGVVAWSCADDEVERVVGVTLVVSSSYMIVVRIWAATTLT